MTEAEILSALRDARAAQHLDDDAGLTIPELATAMGVTQPAIRTLLRPLMAAGRVTAGRRWDVDIAGRRMRRVVYVFRPESPTC